MANWRIITVQTEKIGEFASLSLWSSKLAKFSPNLFALFHLLFPSFILESLLFFYHIYFEKSDRFSVKR